MITIPTHIKFGLYCDAHRIKRYKWNLVTILQPPKKPHVGCLEGHGYYEDCSGGWWEGCMIFYILSIKEQLGSDWW